MRWIRRREAVPCWLVLAGVVACAGGNATREGDPASGAGSGGSAGTRGDPPVSSGLPGDDVFVNGQALDIELTMSLTDYEQLEQHGNLEQYVAASVRLGRAERSVVELPQVGVRHKGNYSLHHCWDDFGGVRSYVSACERLPRPWRAAPRRRSRESSGR